MRTLIVCDIDGVLIDSSSRDHLAPKGKDTLDNRNWVSHQSFTSGDVAIPGCGDRLQLLVNQYTQAEILYLTSRMNINDHISQTLQLLPNVMCHKYSYCFRHERDSRPSHIFKASSLNSFIMSNCVSYEGQYDKIILVDDILSNLESMADVCEYHHIDYKTIHVRNMTEWVRL